MREGDMPIDLRCCLRAAVAVRDLEIEACNSMLAEGAFERRAAIHRRAGHEGHWRQVVFSSVCRRAASVRWRGEMENKLVQLRGRK